MFKERQSIQRLKGQQRMLIAGREPINGQCPVENRFCLVKSLDGWTICPIIYAFKKVLRGLHDSCSSQIDCSLSLYSLALTRVSFRDFPLRYEVRGDSLKIFLTPENEIALT